MALVIFSQPLVTFAVAGLGYIAGEAPDGIVTLDNVPGVAVIDLLRRADHLWLRREFSSDDGTYRFHALPLDVQYDLIGRDLTDILGDVIVSRVEAYGPPDITTPSLAFSAGVSATTQMAVQHGGAPFTWTADVLPPGLTMSASGLWSGTPSAAGTYTVTVTVTDTFGETGARVYTVTVI